MDEGRPLLKLERMKFASCDICGKEYVADKIRVIPAHNAGSAQCDTSICEECTERE